MRICSSNKRNNGRQAGIPNSGENIQVMPEDPGMPPLVTRKGWELPDCRSPAWLDPARSFSLPLEDVKHE